MFPARGRPVRRRTRIETYPAPRRGWVASARLMGAPLDAAEVLDNFFPTAEGARVRRGCSLHATLMGSVSQLVAYVSGSAQRMFAADATTIYDVTSPADAEVVSGAQMTGFTSGDWAWTQFATSGGDFLLMANGTDNLVLYDGSAFNPLAAQAVTNLLFDGQTEPFTVGATVTGGTSGANAVILGLVQSTATTGILKVGTISSGPFQNNEALTDNGTTPGAALVNGSTSSASAVTITGVAGTALSFLWPHKGRLWAVEKDTLSLWYWPAGQIGGTLTEFSIAGVVSYGGAVLFGGTVSMDSGEGMDDRLVIITTEGELVIYAGTDPSDASKWALEGVYRIGRPVSKHGWFRAGGDLVIVTEDGITSVLQAVQQDRAALMAGALTAPIEDAWQRIVARRQAAFPFSCTLWHSQTLLMVGTPTEDSSNPQCFVANTRTGAWARYTGWDVRCSVVHQDRLYFGTEDGRVALAESGGEDFGAPYIATWVPKFSDCKVPDQKFAVSARIMARVQAETRYAITGLADWQVKGLRLPQISTAEDANTWGFGTWGLSIWGGGYGAVTSTEWQKINGYGYALAPAVQIGISRTSGPEVEMIMAQVQYEVGAPL